VTDIELRPLSPPAVGELLADLLGVRPATDLAHLAAVASGNPRALVDLVDGLLNEGLIEVDTEVDARGDKSIDTGIDTSTARLTATRLPERFSFRVRGRLARLSSRARHLVQVASAAGPSFRVSEIAALMRETAAGLLPMIEEALSSGLIVCADDGLDDGIAFSHELVCDIVAGTLPRSIRAALREEVDRARAARPVPGEASRRETRVPAVPAESAAPGPPVGWDGLSDTEQAIAHLVSQALTNRQIATRVHLSPHTINYHLRQIYRKLEINSRIKLASLAQAHDLTQADTTGPHAADSTSYP
jgi:DNA-binding CsgD family transcriptional regulator